MLRDYKADRVNLYHTPVDLYQVQVDLYLALVNL